jgi:hypothetical protein
VHEDLDDMVGWHFDTKGQFSVKSAYKVYIDDVLNGQGTSSGSPLIGRLQEVLFLGIDLEDGVPQ